MARRRRLLKAATRKKLRGWLLRPRLSWQGHVASIQDERAKVIRKRQAAEYAITKAKHTAAGASMARNGVPTFAELRAEAEANPWGEGWAISEPGPSVRVQQSRNGVVFSNSSARHPNAGKQCKAKTQAGGQCRYHLGDDGKCRIDSHNSRR